MSDGPQAHPWKSTHLMSWWEPSWALIPVGEVRAALVSLGSGSRETSPQHPAAGAVWGAAAAARPGADVPPVDAGEADPVWLGRGQ